MIIILSKLIGKFGATSEYLGEGISANFVDPENGQM